MTKDQGSTSDRRQGRASGAAKRIGGFLGRRGAMDKAFAAGRQTADFIGDLTAKIKPKPIDRDGWVGRYTDGGIERFKEMANEMSEFQLRQQLRGWERQRQAFQYTALIAVLTIPIGVVFFDLSRYPVVGLIALFLFAVLRAVRADYFAWIIEQGRFGGFHDYLTTRLPRNMQVIFPTKNRTRRK